MEVVRDRPAHRGRDARAARRLGGAVGLKRVVLLGVRHALVGDVLVRGDVRVEDGRVAAVGVVPAGASGLAAPGFVDLQVNGFAGVDFLTAEPPDYGTAGAALAATGVTAYLPTFISSPEDAYDRAVAAATAARDGRPGPRILGVHLEGPFLSPHWPGAHDPRHLQAPSPALIERLERAGAIALVTLAPELAGRPGADRGANGARDRRLLRTFRRRRRPSPRGVRRRRARDHPPAQRPPPLRAPRPRPRRCRARQAAGDGAGDRRRRPPRA